MPSLRGAGASNARVVALYLPAVPPDPRERRVVGAGLHRVDQRGRAHVRCYPGHDQPKVPGGSRLLRPAPARGPRGAGRRSPGDARDRGLLLLALLVRRPSAPRAPVPRGAAQRASPGFALLSRVGEPDLDRRSGTATATACSIEQTYPGPDDHERHFDAVLPAFARSRGTCASTAGRCSIVYRAERASRRRAVRRAVARRSQQGAGLPGLYLVGERKGGWNATDDGFDADTLPGIYETAPSPRLPGRVGAVISNRRPRRVPTRYPYARLAERPRPASAGPHPELPMVVAELGQHPTLGRARPRPRGLHAGAVRGLDAPGGHRGAGRFRATNASCS